MNLVPKSGERTLCLGKTGSGKSYAMEQIYMPYYGHTQIQILDTKADKGIAKLPGVFVEHLDDVADYTFPEHPLVIYRPCGEELADLDYLDAWCQWVYDRMNTVAVIDELSQLGSPTRPRMGFLNMLTRGRGRDVTSFMGTQRPAGIPKITYTETENFFKFYLADLRDRQRVAEFTHPAMTKQTPGKYGFHYFNPEGRNVYEFTSILPS